MLKDKCELVLWLYAALSAWLRKLIQAARYPRISQADIDRLINSVEFKRDPLTGLETGANAERYALVSIYNDLVDDYGPFWCPVDLDLERPISFGEASKAIELMIASHFGRNFPRMHQFLYGEFLRHRRQFSVCNTKKNPSWF